MTRSTILLLAALVLGASLGGCTKFTKERYSMIRNGQSQLEVEKILGPPTQKFSNTWSYLHDQPFYKAVFAFDKDGKVIDKTWYDAKEFGTHPDAKWENDPNYKSSDAKQSTVVQ